MSQREVNRSDIERVAAQVRLLGERLESHGSALWERSLGWKYGPRAANYDPDTGGWRYECSLCGTPLTVRTTCDCDAEAVPVANDSTGEEALRPHDLNRLHTELRARFARLAADVAWLNGQLEPLMAQPVKPGRQRHDDKMVGADIAAAGWCRSCYRDDQYLEPVHVNKHGRVYRDYCRWCGDWEAESRRIGRTPTEPPLAIIKARHRGERITERMVEAALKKGA